jgi:hypothetical membrane protein
LAIPAALIVFSFVMGSPSKRHQPKYWIAFACVAQPIPVALILREIGLFSPHFEPVWFVSMAVFLIGMILVAVWAHRA